jgi:hypothetical protein
MHTPRTPGSVDVFAAFGAEAEDEGPADDVRSPSARSRSLAVTGGAALVAMVLGALAFVVGLRWGMGHMPGPALANPLLGVLSNVVFAILCGVLLAMVALSVGAVALGIPFVRRHVRR